MVQLALYALINYERQLFCKPFCLVSIVFSPFLFWDISHALVLNTNGLISQDKGNIFVPSNYLYYQSNLVVKDAKKMQANKCKRSVLCISSCEILDIHRLLRLYFLCFISPSKFKPVWWVLQQEIKIAASPQKWVWAVALTLLRFVIQNCF